MFFLATTGVDGVAEGLKHRALIGGYREASMVSELFCSPVHHVAPHVCPLAL
jgi:hypothetical protein